MVSTINIGATFYYNFIYIPGLLYEDIMIEDDAVAKALARADPKELVNRYLSIYGLVFVGFPLLIRQGAPHLPSNGFEHEEEGAARGNAQL